MANLSPKEFFRQSLKSDSYFADEFINIYLLRPLAALVVWALYPTPVTPNAVTIFAVLLGFCSAWSYAVGTPSAVALGGVLIVLKDIFDDADGQLARAKKMYSRRGRFLDSIGDFLVDLAVFAAITYAIAQAYPVVDAILLGVAGLLGISLRVSYHVFYQVSFLHLEDRYKLNRISEEVTEKDLSGDPLTLGLQKIFVLIYGRQDRLTYRLDAWCKGKNFDEKTTAVWYSDNLALRLSGLMGFGTELFILGVCSWTNSLHLYLFINVFALNGIWLVNILYRKLSLAPNLK
jgi:phosphatidylglycerophosphate synthase